MPSTPEGLSGVLYSFRDIKESGKSWRTVGRPFKRSSIRSQRPPAVRKRQLSPCTPNASGAGIVLAPFAFSAASALNLKAPERMTSRAPTPKPLPLGYGEAMLTIGPGRIRASFHQSRSFRITDATPLCRDLWITEAQGTRRNDDRTC